jgi:UDP-N-acetylglucosamine 2-epimerase (non-hydrolysing)
MVKVVTILGTRPEIIRLSRVMALLDEHLDHVIVHTGQNYDYELNEIFFKDLEIRKPDYFLNVETTSLGKVLGDTISKTEGVLLKEKPDAVLILGDTNSCFSGIIARRLKIPLYHMEAGNRCYDFNVPEEINRRLIDHVSDFNLVYTEHARRNLLAEGYPARNIYLTGSPLNEVLNYYKGKIESSNALRELDLESGNYFIVSMHREENVDNPDNLKKILLILNCLAEKYRIPIIVSTHPRTRKMLAGLGEYSLNSLVKLCKPFGFTDYVCLEQNALCTLSDSGTISEESAILNFPAVTIREAIERPEAIDAGTIVLTGLDAEIVLNSVNLVISEHGSTPQRQIPWEYCVENTSWRVLRLILGTCRLSNKWRNIIPPQI